MHLYKPVVKDTPHFASQDIASVAQYSLCSCLVLNRSSLTKAYAFFFFAFFIGSYILLQKFEIFCHGFPLGGWTKF